MTTQSLAERIRPLKARNPARRPGVRANPARALAALALREQVATVLEPYLVTLRDAISELWPKRRLFDGAWLLGLEADLPSGSFKGRPYRAYSRLEFALRIDADARSYELTASSTAYDRDLPSERFEGTLDPASLGQLEVFIEHHALLFATRFYERAPRRGSISQAA